MTTAQKKTAADARRALETVRVHAGGRAGEEIPPWERVAHQDHLLDLVEPVIGLRVFGIPASQGSHVAIAKGVLREDNPALKVWRQAIRDEVKKVVAQRRGWVALKEGVVIRATFVLPATAASRKRGDIYATIKPDADKLARALGDAISPEPVSNAGLRHLPPTAAKQAREQQLNAKRRWSILHDDSYVAGWDVCKAYVGVAGVGMDHPGVMFQVWRVADLEQAAQRPTRVADGREWARIVDVQRWLRPPTHRTWGGFAAAAWRDAPDDMVRRVTEASTPEIMVVNECDLSVDDARTLVAAQAKSGPEDHVIIAQ